MHLPTLERISLFRRRLFLEARLRGLGEQCTSLCRQLGDSRLCDLL